MSAPDILQRMLWALRLCQPLTAASLQRMLDADRSAVMCALKVLLEEGRVCEVGRELGRHSRSGPAARLWTISPAEAIPTAQFTDGKLRSCG